MALRQAAQFVGGSLAPSDFITSMGWRDGVANFGTADASGYGEKPVGSPAALAVPCSAPLKDTRPAKFPKGSQG